MTEPLSPRTQKVLDAIDGVTMPIPEWEAGKGPRAIAAAAIRALVGECAYTARFHPENSELSERVIDETDALAIARELEGGQ